MPNRPNGLPKSVTVNSLFRGAVPPRAPTAPMPPIWIANPQIQKPRRPSA